MLFSRLNEFVRKSFLSFCLDDIVGRHASNPREFQRPVSMMKKVFYPCVIFQFPEFDVKIDYMFLNSLR